MKTRIILSQVAFYGWQPSQARLTQKSYYISMFILYQVCAYVCVKIEHFDKCMEVIVFRMGCFENAHVLN